MLVNGFQQLPAQLEPAAGGSRERAFRTDLLLSQAANNRVEIALPGLEQDASNRTEFLVNCKDPARAQRLHLILVSLNEEDAKGLDSKFLKLLEPAFEGVDVYGPQVGYRAGRAYVLQQLQKVRYRIQGLTNARAPTNHIVVFYYQGGESVNAQGNFFQTSLHAANAAQRQNALTCDDLVEFVGQTPGAHVLLFDVDRQPVKSIDAKDKLARWNYNYPDVESQVALLRYAWLAGTAEPRDLRLVQALQQAVPQAKSLGEVTEQVYELARSSYYPESLKVDKYVADEMQNMPLTKQR